MKIITVKLRKIILGIILMIILSIGLKYGIDSIRKVIYPIKYEEYIIKYSKEYNVDPLFITSIIRVESKFDKDATSIKNARGLMQIASITGNWAAEELGIENYSDELLYDPETNIRIGCWYVDKLRTQFDDNMLLVIASYNGGSGNVSKWLKDKRYSDDGENLKNIPFKETDNYVKRVTRSYHNYRKIYAKELLIGDDHSETNK